MSPSYSILECYYTDTFTEHYEEYFLLTSNKYQPTNRSLESVSNVYQGMLSIQIYEDNLSN